MRKSSLALGTAVGSILAASSAMAIDISGYATQLTISGSSAQQATFKAQMGTLCSGGAVTEWNVAGVSPTPNIRAYTCSLDGTNADVIAAGLPGGNAVVWYRAEGGSVYGVAPIENNVPIYRIKLDSNCDDVAHTCPITAFALASETGTGNIELAPTEMGVSDVEPGQFKGENWPIGPVFGTGPQTTIGGVGLNGVVFGVAVSNFGATAGILDLSRAAITGIFSGKYTNWNQVPTADGAAKFPGGVIHVCRRDVGSGTQASTSIYFNHQGCSSSSYAFVVPGGRIHQNNTGGQMTTCLAGTANGGFDGSIGFYNGDPLAPAANTHFVTIDGVANTKTNAAIGKYRFWFEGTANLNPNINNTLNASKLANLMIAKLQAVNAIPASSSTIALPGGVNPATTPLTVSANGIPVALYSHAGDSCKYIR